MDAASEYARQHGLTKVGGRPRFRVYMKSAWGNRVFIYSLAKFRIQAANQRARLGMWWVVVGPILNAIVYGVVFGLIQGPMMRPDNFVQFLVVGVFFFQFFSSCLDQGSRAITSNMALVQSLRFPRIVLPLAVVTQQLLNFAPMVVVIVLINLAFGARPEPSWLLLIPLILVFTLFNTGICLITARLTVHVRDLTQLLPFLTRFMFYTSGVFFQVSRVLEQWPVAVRVYDFHPLHVFLTIGRSAFLDTVNAPLEYWGTAVGWSLLVLFFGMFYFWKAEERYGRDD